MPKCLICDLDGTLIDSRKDLTAGTNLMRAHYDLKPLSVDTITSYIGNGARKLVERSLQDIDVDIDEALKLLKKYYRENMLNETTLYPTVKEGVALLTDNDWKLAVVTNKPGDLAKQILQHLNIADFFIFIFGGDSEFPLKPDPAAINYIVSETGADKKNTWIMGDNYTDLEAGRHAEINRCFAEYGFGVLNDEKYELGISSFKEFCDKML